MEPRVVFRTHYQVDEPAIVELLVKVATSPVHSSYDEKVASKLAKEIQRRHKNFNVAAGGYALDLGRELGVVNEQNAWTTKGHLVNLVAAVDADGWEDQLQLTPGEVLLHFRLFLEADGGALLFLAKFLLEHGRVPNSDGDWNKLAERLFVETYREYLKAAGTTADRVRLRTEIDRISKKGYSGKTGSHKMFVHLQTLYRLGLVGKQSNGATRLYELTDQESTHRLTALSESIRDVYGLEQVIAEHRWVDVAAAVFVRGASPAKLTSDELLSFIVDGYRTVMATGIPLCPIDAPLEALQIDLLARRGQLLTFEVAMNLLKEAQSTRPREIRFHVDRRGRPAFLRLSDELVTRQAG